MINLLEVKARPGYRLWLRYSDGVEGEVDLGNLVGRSVFEVWEDPAAFERVSVEEGRIVSWGEGSEAIDLCANALYVDLTGKKPEEVFESLERVLTESFSCPLSKNRGKKTGRSDGEPKEA